MVIQDQNMPQADPDLEGASNSLLKNTRCCCFCLPSFTSRRSSSSSSSSSVGLSWWERLRTSQHQNEGQWWTRGIRALMRAREWSEIVAGPRWKTFIRKFNRSRSGGANRHGKYQYDPLSYALNFDEGPGQNGDLDEGDDFGLYRNFSSRYASVPGSVNASRTTTTTTSSSSGIDVHGNVKMFA